MFPTKITYFGMSNTEYNINNREDQPTLWEEAPYYYIEADIEGLRGADISFESHPIPNAIGESSGDIFRRGKGLAISGKITGLNLSTLESGADYLQEMFAKTNKRKLVWRRWADGITVYLNCRVNQDLVVVEKIDSFNYSYEFTVGLRADDPRTRKLEDDSIYPDWQE